jgi:predicted ATPase
VPGFSGAPIWDDDVHGVIGMVNARDHDPEEEIQVGFGLSSEALDRHLRAAGISVTWVDGPPPEAAGHALPTAFRHDWLGISGHTLLSHQLLLGRERELASGADRLTAGVQILTLTGPGGVGKTCLALHIARRLSDRFDRLHVIELGSLRDHRLVMYELAARLGVSARVGMALPEAIQVALAGTRTLIVLDNFEHVLDAAPLVADLVAALPDLRLLVTSQARLNIRAERELVLRPLALPRPSQTAASELVDIDAVALFVHRATAVDASFTLSDENAPDVASICRRVEGLPLAIELAAARMKLMAPAALLERLSSPLDVLAENMRDRPRRHRSLRAALDWSFNLLKPPHRDVIAQMSVFGGGWTLRAAEAVCISPDGLLIDVMADLIDNSLVRRLQEGMDSRYEMSETVRDYAQSMLAASGLEPGARERHAIWYLGVAESLAPGREHHDQGSSLASLDQEAGNIRVALGWLRLAGRLELALRLAASVAWYWDLRAAYDEGRDWLEGLLVDASAGRHGVSDGLVSHACCEAALLAFRQGDYRHAATRYEDSLRSTPAGDQRRRAWALHGRAMVLRELGDSSGSASSHAEARRLFEDVGDLLGIAEALSHSAVADFYAGRIDAAQAAAERARHLFGEAGHLAGVATAVTLMGIVARHRGDQDLATRYMEEGLSIRRALQDRRGMSASLINLGLLALYRPDPAAALRLLSEAQTLNQAFGDKRGLALALNNTGVALYEVGRYDDATSTHERAADVSRYGRSTRDRPLPAQPRQDVDRRRSDRASPRTDHRSPQHLWGRAGRDGDRVLATGGGGCRPAQRRPWRRRPSAPAGDRLLHVG